MEAIDLEKETSLDLMRGLMLLEHAKSMFELTKGDEEAIKYCDDKINAIKEVLDSRWLDS